MHVRDSELDQFRVVNNAVYATSLQVRCMRCGLRPVLWIPGLLSAALWIAALLSLCYPACHLTAQHTQCPPAALPPRVPRRHRHRLRRAGGQWDGACPHGAEDAVLGAATEP